MLLKLFVDGLILTEGTIVINGTTLEIHGGKKGDKSISKIEVEKEYIVDGLKGLPAGWRVEEDFINSIVKGAPVIHSPFDVGVQYINIIDNKAKPENVRNAAE